MITLLLGKHVQVIDHILKTESFVSIVLKIHHISIIQWNNVKTVLIILFLIPKLQDVSNNFTLHWLILILNQECLDMIIILLQIIKSNKMLLNNHIHMFYVMLLNLLEQKQVVLNVINQLPTLISEKNNVQKSSI